MCAKKNFFLQNLDESQVWHGNEHVLNITSDNLDQLSSLDGKDRKLMSSTFGILKALQFLEDVLLKTPPDVQEIIKEHSEEESHIKKRRARYKNGRYFYINVIKNPY